VEEEVRAIELARLEEEVAELLVDGEALVEILVQAVEEVQPPVVLELVDEFIVEDARQAHGHVHLEFLAQPQVREYFALMARVGSTVEQGQCILVSEEVQEPSQHV
jgi:hypothetical protein